MADYIDRQRMNIMGNFLIDKNGILQNFRLDPSHGITVSQTNLGAFSCEYTGKFAAMLAKKLMMKP